MTSASFAPTTGALPSLQAHLCPQTVSALLERAVALGPDIEAIVAPDGRLTYRELADEVAHLRRALRALGVARGDHVGICLGNSAQWMALFLALGSLGATTVAINTRFVADELAYVLGQAKISHLFIADQVASAPLGARLLQICPELADSLPAAPFPDLRHVVMIGSEVPKGALSWDDFYRVQSEEVAVCDRPEDILLIQYTSGTTSFPKGVLLPHAAMLTNGFIASQRMGLRSADRYHSARPFFHVAGSTLSILTALHAVATLVTMARFQAAEALALLEAEGCTHFSGNDTMVLMLLNAPERAHHQLSLRGGWVAGSPSVMGRVIDDLGAREVVGAYGLSEAAPNVALGCWWEPEEVRRQSLMRVQPGIELQIRDPDSGSVLPMGAVGEIYLRGYSVMRGYFDKPRETAEVLDAEGWLATGDLGRLDGEGRLAFVGRAKEIVRVGGENVSPLEVEDMLNRHPAVRQAQVVGVPDPRLVEVIAAVLVLNEGAHFDEATFGQWCKERLAGFKLPRHILCVESFEAIGMTASAKIKRSDLAAYAVQRLGLGHNG